MDSVVFFQPLKHLMLGVIGGPVAHTLGQSGCGETGFTPQVSLQRMHRFAPSPQGFVEPPPQLHRAKKRRHRAGMLAASPIESSLKQHPRRRLIIVFGLQVIQRPSHDTSTNVAKQRAEFVFKGHHLLGRRFVLDKLIKEPNTTGE